MGQKAEQFLHTLLALAHQNGGLALIETGVCSACGKYTFCFHAMAEVFPCGECGHRNASKFSRYQIENDAAVDAQ